MSHPPIISGLYPYIRDGEYNEPVVTLDEIPKSLDVNPWYADEMLVLAGGEACAGHLESFGLEVDRVFTDAPDSVHRNTAHLMKHWMCLWALREFDEFLWVDWDTVCLRRPDADFWRWCRQAGTPKFIRIPNYWATVNCGVYYASEQWIGPMVASFEAEVSEPNDELLWTTVLPDDVLDRPEFWLGNRALNIWEQQDYGLVGTDTYFAHVRDLEMADALRTRHRDLVAAGADSP